MSLILFLNGLLSLFYNGIYEDSYSFGSFSNLFFSISPYFFTSQNTDAIQIIMEKAVSDRRVMKSPIVTDGPHLT